MVSVLSAPRIVGIVEGVKTRCCVGPKKIYVAPPQVLGLGGGGYLCACGKRVERASHDYVSALGLLRHRCNCPRGRVPGLNVRQNCREGLAQALASGNRKVVVGVTHGQWHTVVEGPGLVLVPFGLATTVVRVSRGAVRSGQFPSQFARGHAGQTQLGLLAEPGGT